ncbi:MAG: MBL fold metallo-hydrolase [Bacteriovoracaceae bacterium]|nr:MBL fold metallo-hydrolase [Bacteriovoracaceae bacterium]
MENKKSNAPIIEAVTIVLTCKNNLFMVKRSESMRHFPGFFAFFGGKVDVGENHLRALEREFEEESGRALSEREIQRVNFIGHSSAPFAYPYRFRTHYYHLELEEIEEFSQDSKDSQEFQFGKWQTFEEWYHQYRQGELLVVPPVLKILECLHESGHFKEWRPTEITDYPVGVEFLAGVLQMFVPSETLPPAKETNCFVIHFDDGSRLAVDPAPIDEEGRLALVSKLKRLQVNDFFITHYHSDHWDALGNLFELFSGKIYLSQDTWDIFQKRYVSYWQKISSDRIVILKDSDLVLGIWKQQKIRAIPIPGHATGHLGLMSENKTWFLVGDLIQGTDSVVVGGENGDMDDYLQSLEKVIELAPSVIFPSHGLPLGGTFFLKKLLKHRLYRETEIASLLKRNLSVQQIAHTLYPNLSGYHLQLAEATIEAHLKRLKKLESGR